MSESLMMRLFCNSLISNLLHNVSFCGASESCQVREVMESALDFPN